MKNQAKNNSAQGYITTSLIQKISYNKRRNWNKYIACKTVCKVESETNGAKAICVPEFVLKM